MVFTLESRPTKSWSALWKFFHEIGQISPAAVQNKEDPHDRAS
jgi:hypothetical protein